MSGRRKVLAVSAVIAATIFGAATTAGPAGAAGDVTPPKLTVSSPAYIVGSQMPAIGEAIVDIPLEARWTASDSGTGICGYSLDRREYIGDVEPVKPFYSSNARTGSFTYLGNDYFSSGTDEAFLLNAYDCAGNMTTREASTDVGVADVGYTPVSGWSRVDCDCAIGGNMLRTSTAGRSLSHTVNGVGQHVAVAMAKGPARGKAAIYLDGVLKQTVDTYAASNVNRIVVWDSVMPTSGTHTIKVVNLATANRPRIDVDSFFD